MGLAVPAEVNECPRRAVATSPASAQAEVRSTAESGHFRRAAARRAISERQVKVLEKASGDEPGDGWILTTAEISLDFPVHFNNR